MRSEPASGTLTCRLSMAGRCAARRTTWLAAAATLFFSSALVSAAPPAVAEAAAEQADWRAKLKVFALEHFRNPAWGHSHSARIYGLARQLAAEDGVTLDDDVLYAAAWLHDMAAFPPWFDAARDHADVAAELAEGQLRGTGFPMQKVDAVRSAIRTHMYFRDPVGPEATYLHDADALDWLGAIGAARMLALADPNGGAPDAAASVKMIEDNLAKVPGRLFSPAGKAREAGRRDELDAFMRALKEQTAGFAEL
jgi:HD superfamily phosphodiesterase